MRRTLLALLSVCSFAVMAATPAAAIEPHQTVVRYSDLNLESGAGQDHLLNRIERAADITCFARSGPMPLRERQSILECKAAVMQRAVADLGNARVAQRFALRGGELPALVIASR